MVWFSGLELHEPREQEFVEVLGKSAEAGAFPGVVPGDTVSGSLSESSGKGITIGMAVPKLTCQRRWLVVSYEPGQDQGTPVLQSSWSTDVQLDTPPGAYDGPSSDSDLWVCGIDAGPSFCAPIGCLPGLGDSCDAQSRAGNGTSRRQVPAQAGYAVRARQQRSSGTSAILTSSTPTGAPLVGGGSLASHHLAR